MTPTAPVSYVDPKRCMVPVIKKWNELSPHSRRFIVVAATIEGVLKAAALVDLSRRPAAEVKGPKWRWAIAVTFVNSLGAVPVAYFLYGRRRGPETR